MVWALFIVDCLVIYAIGRSVILKSNVRDVWAKCAPYGWQAYPGVLVECSREVWRYLKDDSRGDEVILIGSILPTVLEAVLLLAQGLGATLPNWWFTVLFGASKLCLAVFFLNGRFARAVRQRLLWIQPPS